MAKTAIVASLRLDSSDYDKKLAKAKKNTKNFSQGGMSDFTKLATAIATSKAAMEVFNRVIASSQTIGDTYAQTMHTAKSAVDQFVYSIANADFSRFNMGISDIITKSREAYNALDQLGNTQISYNYITGRNRAALRENLLKVRDVSLPMSEREAALSASQGLYEDIRTQTNTYKATTEKYIKAALAEVSGLMSESIQMEDFVDALMIDIGTDPAAARKMIEKQYKAYKDAADAISAYGSKTTTNAYGQMVANPLYDPERAKADMAALNESNRSLLVAYNLLFRYTDEELQKLTGYLTQADNASYAVGEFATQIREAGNSLNQSIKPGTVGAALIDPSQYKPQGLGTMAGIGAGTSASALSSMEMAVTGYTDKIVKAVVDNAVAKANNINRDYVTRENIDRIMELDLMPGGDEEKARLKAIYDQYKDIREQQMAYQREAERQADRLKNGEQYTLNPLTGEKELNLYKAARIQRRRDEAQSEADRLNAMVATNAEYQQAALYNAMLVKGTDEWLQEMTSLIIKADNAKGSLAEMQTATYEVANQLNQPVTLEAVQPVILYEKELQTLQDTAVSASEGLGALGNAFGNMSGMLGEGAGAWMNYAGGIISAVGSALPSLEALAAAQAAAAVTKTALSPWTVVSGIAAVTSIVAAMAQLPKFATGGVVPGNAPSGDNVLIRANSGEVVLTKSQANNIGSLLNGGLGGKVVFEIDGSRLVGVLNNHNSITSRSYGH